MGIRFALALALVLLWMPFLEADTIHVPQDQPTIQAGINAASGGDTVLVAPGTYVENIDFMGQAIMVKSSGGPDLTVIDGNQSGSVVTLNKGEQRNSVFEGFTITNGNNSGIHLGNQSAATIKGNVISFNRSAGTGGGAGGGGIYCSQGASPEIMDNIISHNDCFGEHGGGIKCMSALFFNNSMPSIHDNLIEENHAGLGGAIYIRAHWDVQYRPEIFSNRIRNNTASSGGGGLYVEKAFAWIWDNDIKGNQTEVIGGGILCIACDDGAWISGNRISMNSSMEGGAGIHVQDIDMQPSYLTLQNNTIMGNKSRGPGGGICSLHADILVSGNLIARNYARLGGGGISCQAGKVFGMDHNTIVDNETPGWGGGIQGISAPAGEAFNSIIRGNTPSQIEFDAPVAYTFTHCNVEGGWPGVGNIDLDPLFAEPSMGDYHLTWPSPCREAGIHSLLYFTDLDFEGDPRTAGAETDMGADEFHDHLYCTEAAGPSEKAYLKFVSAPGSGPILLGLGESLVSQPVNSPFGEWFIDTPLTVIQGFSPIPADGVLVLEGRVPALPVGPYTVYFQSLIGTSLTNYCGLRVD